MIIALNNVRSAWNVGAIMRTCDALGADIILVGYTPKPVGHTLKMVAKTAIGAENTVKWEHFDHYNEVLEKYSDYAQIAVEISKTSYNAFDFFREKMFNWDKTVLWLGNEIAGLEPEMTAKMDYELHLPMLGMKESLNVASTACTIGYLFLEHSGKTFDKTSS